MSVRMAPVHSRGSASSLGGIVSTDVAIASSAHGKTKALSESAAPSEESSTKSLGGS